MRRLVSPTGRDIECDAIHANKGVEAWYRKKLQDMLQRCANSMVRHIEAAWKAHTPDSGFASDAPTPTVALNRALKKWGGLWQRKFNAMSLDLGRKFVTKNFNTTDRAFSHALKKAGFTVQFAPSKRSVQNFHAVLHENVGLIKSIPEEFLKDVSTAVWQSVMRGGDMGTLRATLQKEYGIAHRRASFIARDQNNKAKAVIENTRRIELLGTEAEAAWRHSGGGKKPRPHHEKWGKEKKRYKLSEGMYDPVAKQYVWPGTEPNCRCTSKTIIPGFDKIK